MENRHNPPSQKYPHKSIVNPSVNSSISTTQSNAINQAALHTTIHIETENKKISLTNQEYSTLKLNAIAEFEEMTSKGKKTIENSVITAKTNAKKEKNPATPKGENSLATQRQKRQRVWQRNAKTNYLLRNNRHYCLYGNKHVHLTI